MNQTFGDYVRQRREFLRRTNKRYSVRQLAYAMGVGPSYLSKVERNEARPPSEAKIADLAAVLLENTDVLLAKAGKVAVDLQAAIRKRPELFGQVIRGLARQPDDVLERLVREFPVPPPRRRSIYDREDP